MILDYDWSARDRKFTISYINEKGTKSFYEFNINRFKTYYATPTGKLKNWDGTPCDVRYTDRPCKFDIKEFIEDLPQNVKDNLFASWKPKLYSFDIETLFDPDEKPDPQTAKFPVTAISIVNPDMTVMVLGYKPLEKEAEERIRERIQKYLDDIEFFRELKIKSNFMYKRFDNEHDMLEWFLKNIVSKVPILAGWNSDGFDWQYICNRVKNYYEDISLASCSCKYRMTQKKVVNIFRPTDFVRVPIPYHTHVVDFMDVIRQHDYTVLPMKESMSLDWISNAVLGVNKIKYKGNLNTLFEDDFEWFVFYNAIDSVLVQLLHKRFKTFNIIYDYANITHLPIGDCYGKIAPAEALFFQNFHKRGLKVVWYPDRHPDRGYLIGAFVKEPIPGLYVNPCCFDFSGLYPTNVMVYNLSVENFVGAFYDEEKLRPYRADTDKYVVVCGSVYTNANAGKPNKKPDPDKFIAQFLDEEKLRPYREDPNYIVSINGHVYRNDQDYAFRQIQLELKQNRNKTKYLAKNLDAQVISVIDRILETHKNGDWTPFSEDVQAWMSKTYNINDKHDIAKYSNLEDLKHKILEDIESFYSREQSFKLLGNSAYGGSSHPAFYWFNIEMANDITGEGRNLIHMMEKKTQNVFDTFNTMTDVHKKLGITIDQDLYKKNVTNCVSTIYQDTDSSYVNMGPIVNSINELKGKDDKERCSFLIKFADQFWNGYFDKILTEYINSRHGKNYHVFELETIAKTGIWIGVKKRYAQSILCKDGRVYDKPKIKIKGLEIAKSSYPLCARETLSQLVNMLLLDDTTEPGYIYKLNQKMMMLKQDFCQKSADDVSMAIKVTDYWKSVESDSDPTGLKLKKGISYNARALANYNWLINTKGLAGDNIYGGKVKCYLIKKRMRNEQDNYFAYEAGNYPEWGSQYAPIDYDGMFMKTVLEPINRIVTKIGLQELHVDGSIEMDLFSGLF